MSNGPELRVGVMGSDEHQELTRRIMSVLDQLNQDPNHQFVSFNHAFISNLSDYDALVLHSMNLTAELLTTLTDRTTLLVVIHAIANGDDPMSKTIPMSSVLWFHQNKTVKLIDLSSSTPDPLSAMPSLTTLPRVLLDHFFYSP